MNGYRRYRHPWKHFRGLELMEWVLGPAHRPNSLPWCPSPSYKHAGPQEGEVKSPSL